MTVTSIYVTLEGKQHRYEVPLSGKSLALLRGGEGVDAERLALTLLRVDGYIDKKLTNLSSVSWRMTIGHSESPFDVMQTDAEMSLGKNMTRCRSLLARASCLLPPGEREEALDEWTDEIETAAGEGRPILRRTLSIVFRALPTIAVRIRMHRPSRAPRGGG